GSNAWAVSASRTRSGRPLLAGDPHIGFAVPAVWYEAELSAPGFELYGYFQALNPFALLGHNRDFGWSLTMFQNDDVDLIAERSNPANPEQVMI
ncbi:penicillin acylase family protein, partial [Pantoea agglomerans]